MSREAPPQQQQQQQQRSLLGAVWETRLYRCLAILFIYCFGFATLIPALPSLFTNYFASRDAGHPLDCEQFPPGQQPQPCRDAHATVVTWSSWTSLVSNTLLTFLCAPLVGDLSDAMGRKPFLVAAFALATLPVAVVLAYLVLDTPLLWYYPVNAVSGLVSSIVVMLSYAADVLQPQERTAGFGLVVAAFALGFMVGPQLGQALTPLQAAWVAFGCCVASVVWTLTMVPESLQQRQEPGQAPLLKPARPRPLGACLSLGRSWRLINSCGLFQKLALCVAITGVVSEGIQDLLVQYLQLVVGFNTRDQAALFTVIGAANLVVQAVVLPVLAPRWGEQRLLLVGLLLSCVQQALLALVATKAQALGAVALGGLAGVSYPAISAIKANCCSSEQQGLVQGALAGIRALASGLGPLAFAQVFAWTTRSASSVGYHPSVVFWCSCALTSVAVAVAATVPVDAGRGGGGTGAGQYAAVAADDDAEAACGADAPEARGGGGGGGSYEAPAYQAAWSVRFVDATGKERINSLMVRSSVVVGGAIEANANSGSSNNNNNNNHSSDGSRDVAPRESAWHRKRTTSSDQDG